MLLWLTLALLWSSTCWAGQTFGCGKGKHFSISRGNEDELTGIRVYTSPMGLIKSIQLRYGSSWSGQHGIPGGKSHELLLQPGEHITKIYGTYRRFIQHLTIFTDRNGQASFGKKIGVGFWATPDRKGKVLSGVHGRHQRHGLTSIGFLWDYPQGGMTSTQKMSAVSKK
ncbi:pancreatic adenocarcinoma up-regulated factor-like [Camelus dromedarius]|uniref:Zymogen granule protein 16 homolog B-like n=2 Tax=Camelus TaxID=9836 RepID=A0A8B8RGC6_CAMFR|nr:zymogen granule protein 16 homolog B-like [Camelus bactrianus]XP_010990962.1 zymogen granule protein 16 homolog B-like [Camelus dromedarius]XP_032316947.1 zymogen granule protein 16 homolog B-like [Camelus ferus]